MTFYRTRWVTFPRSGHHWAVRLVQHALPGIVYEEHHTTGKTLENSPEVHLQKTHDFALDVPISNEFRHIVQVRDFVKSMESWQRQRDALQLPEMRATAMLKYYQDFILKWVIGDVPNRLIVHYGDLLTIPVATIMSVITHISDIGPFSATDCALKAVKYELPNKRE